MICLFLCDHKYVVEDNTYLDANTRTATIYNIQNQNYVVRIYEIKN